MHIRTLGGILILCVLLASPNVHAAREHRQKYARTTGPKQLCQNYILDADQTIKFNDNEKKLICGDPDAASWEDIPRFESEYFIKTFLQDRGYFYPTFTEEGDVVTIHPGERTQVTDIDVTGSPPVFFDVTRRRKIKDQVLTPALLNTLENWTRSQLKANGYPCPAVISTADAKTGEVKLSIQPGAYQRIVEVIEEPVEGLRPGTLARYRAFNIGDPYNVQNLSLTSTRIETTDGILQSSYFLTECQDEGAVLTQKSLAGPKRLLRIGVGASTEDYIIGKLTMKWARIGAGGSSIELSARGSYRKQWLNAQAFIYPLPFPTRWHFNPLASTRRLDESQFEYTEFDAAFPLAVTFDTANIGFRMRFGPWFNYTRTESGAQPGNTYFVTAGVRLDVASHDYDYYIADPREGFSFNALADFNSDKIGSSVTAQRFQVGGDVLWNIADFDPPLFVVALRGLAGTTLTDTGSSSFARLPPSFLYYLGGSMNLRGFTRYSLPQGNRGALTALYAGAEARLTNVLPFNFQPMVFADVGMLGQKSFDLDFPVYWSPGFGVRWPSMVGVFRVTLAHGLLINNNNPANNGLEGWQFFWSFGEEF